LVARTTITLDDDLLSRLKARAESCGQPLSRVIEDALRAGFEPAKERPAQQTELPSWPLGDLQDGATIGSLGKALADLDVSEAKAAAREGRSPSFKV
jgi:predicted transcriptional regulator